MEKKNSARTSALPMSLEVLDRAHQAPVEANALPHPTQPAQEEVGGPWRGLGEVAQAGGPGSEEIDDRRSATDRVGVKRVSLSTCGSGREGPAQSFQEGPWVALRALRAYISGGQYAGGRSSPCVCVCVCVMN